jgi:hypothetical protein
MFTYKALPWYCACPAFAKQGALQTPHGLLSAHRIVPSNALLTCHILHARRK